MGSGIISAASPRLGVVNSANSLIARVSLSLSLRHYIVANQILGNRLRSRIGSLTNISHLHDSAWSLQLGASKPESSDDRKWRPTLEEPERERKRNNKEWDSWKRDFLKKKKRKKKEKREMKEVVQQNGGA